MVNEQNNGNIKSTVCVYFRLVFNIESKRNHLPCFSNTKRLEYAVVSDGQLHIFVERKLSSN